MEPMNVLISLHRGYGLGDAVQMSAVLQHVCKYQPNWKVDYQAEEGKHQVGRGIVANTFDYGTPYPHDPYDAEVQIVLYDRWYGFVDRPNTHVSSCLRECFAIGWDAECGRYRVEVSKQALLAAKALTLPTNYKAKRGNRVVAVHYQGDSSPDSKNLTHEQAALICKEVEVLDCTPLLLDWRNTSPLPNREMIRATGQLPESCQWGGNAEMNCAVISRCAAFVGIDSGPAKCASATNTPALVIWTGHHPAQFHDPCNTTTHLVPRGYHGLKPICNDRDVVSWFEKSYVVRQYDRDPVGEVAVWLREVLR